MPQLSRKLSDSVPSAITARRHPGYTRANPTRPDKTAAHTRRPNLAQRSGYETGSLWRCPKGGGGGCKTGGSEKAFYPTQFDKGARPAKPTLEPQDRLTGIPGTIE